MSKVYDLSGYLEEKRAKIVIGVHEFEIRDGFNDLLKIDALTSKREELGSTEFVKEFLNISLGEEATKYGGSVKLTLKMADSRLAVTSKTSAAITVI